MRPFSDPKDRVGYKLKLSSLGATHKEPISVELTPCENHFEDFVDWELNGHLKIFGFKQIDFKLFEKEKSPTDLNTGLTR